MMESDTVVVEETPAEAAESIATALEFLRREADSAGLGDVGDLIQQASAKARDHGASQSAAELEIVCRALARLPADCRRALVFKKVYRRSCGQIARDCNVSEATAKTRLIDGFRALRATL
ncbi:RNA polymerase sigma factor [Woeseia oceani]|nr:sigma factor-like helix-turn-helix DNA-binding protein [Woeseia oceani]